MDVKVTAYKERLINAKYFVMFMWQDDDMVVPKETQWFSDWDRQGNEIPLKDQQLYKDDWLGLRTMYEEGRLIFYSGPGKHMDLFTEAIRD